MGRHIVTTANGTRGQRDPVRFKRNAIGREHSTEDERFKPEDTGTVPMPGA